MKKTNLSMPELAFIAGTRAALGAGATLLFGDRLAREQKKAVGWTLSSDWCRYNCTDSGNRHQQAKGVKQVS